MYKIARLVILLVLFIVLSGHSPDLPAMSYIIAGEAGGCSVEAKIAVAYMVNRGAEFNGWKQPSEEDILVAVRWFNYPDYSNGAWSWFDNHDRNHSEPEIRKVVNEIISQKVEVAGFPECGDVRLYAPIK